MAKPPRVVDAVAAEEPDLVPVLVAMTRQPSTFSSKTQPGRWNGWLISVGCIGTTANGIAEDTAYEYGAAVK